MISLASDGNETATAAAATMPRLSSSPTTTVIRAIEVTVPDDLPSGSVFLAKLAVGPGSATWADTNTDDDADIQHQDQEDEEETVFFRVTIPEGGAKRGDVVTFTTTTTADDGECDENEEQQRQQPAQYQQQPERATPAGRWKDGIFDCFRYGYLHPSTLNACLCPHVMVAQLSNRISLPLLPSSWGRTRDAAASTSSSPSSSKDALLQDNVGKEGLDKGDNAGGSSSTTRRRVVALFVLACLLDAFLVAPFLDLRRASSTSTASIGGTFELPTSSSTLWMEFAYLVWSVALTGIAVRAVVRLRAAVRAKHDIPTGWCGSAEDLCCVVWCHGCALAQMARQTANYSDESDPDSDDDVDEEEERETDTAACCTVTGLSNSKRLDFCSIV